MEGVKQADNTELRLVTLFSPGNCARDLQTCPRFKVFTMRWELTSVMSNFKVNLWFFVFYLALQDNIQKKRGKYREITAKLAAAKETNLVCSVAVVLTELVFTH